MFMFSIIHFLTASACRTVTQRYLKKCWKTPKDAEAFYLGGLSASVGTHTSQLHSLSDQPAAGTENCDNSSSAERNIYVLLNQFSRSDQLSILSKLFTKVILDYLKVSVPDDFLVFTAKAMDYLKCNDRRNVLYKWPKV